MNDGVSRNISTVLIVLLEKLIVSASSYCDNLANLQKCCYLVSRILFLNSAIA